MAMRAAAVLSATLFFLTTRGGTASEAIFESARHKPERCAADHTLLQHRLGLASIGLFETGQSVGVTPFNCSKYDMPVQVVRESGGYGVRGLNLDGTYSPLYHIPFTRTSPSFKEINGCAIDPIDSIVYCCMVLHDRQAYLVRLDEARVEFVARMNFSWSAGFSPGGTYYAMSSDRLGLYALRRAHQRRGYASATDPKLVASPMLHTSLDGAGSDLVVVSANLEGGRERDYTVSVYGGKVKVSRATGTPGTWTLSSRGPSYPPGSTSFGAAWHFGERVFFAANSGAGVFEVNISSIDLEREEVNVTWVCNSVETQHNDGMNCMTVWPPEFTSTTTTVVVTTTSGTTTAATTTETESTVRATTTQVTTVLVTSITATTTEPPTTPPATIATTILTTLPATTRPSTIATTASPTTTPVITTTTTETTTALPTTMAETSTSTSTWMTTAPTLIGTTPQPTTQSVTTTSTTTAAVTTVPPTTTQETTAVMTTALPETTVPMTIATTELHTTMSATTSIVTTVLETTAAATTKPATTLSATTEPMVTTTMLAKTTTVPMTTVPETTPSVTTSPATTQPETQLSTTQQGTTLPRTTAPVPTPAPATTPFQTTVTTKTTTTTAAEGTCVLWGEPHVRVFDAVARGPVAPQVLDLLRVGDFWLVRSQLVSIQGRYRTTRWTNGQAATSALAIGGPFLQNHTLIVESLAGRVTFDNVEVLQDLPSEFTVPGLIGARYHGEAGSSSLDPGLAYLPLKSVELDLPLGVRLTVNRWAEHVDALIAMRAQPGGQDGHCGNFNGDPDDDTAELMEQRMHVEVEPEALLFPTSSRAEIQPQAVTLTDCPPSLRARAERLCNGHGVAERLPRASCVFDVCFGGEEYAEADVAMDRQLAALPSPVRIAWAAHPNFCLDVGGGRPLDGSVLQLWTCQAGHPDMQFLLPAGGRGQIRWAAHPSMCLDVARGESLDGTRVQWWHCEAGHRDMQFIVPAGSKGQIRWASNPGMCLDITDGQQELTNHVQLWTCIEGGSPNQELLLERT